MEEKGQVNSSFQTNQWMGGCQVRVKLGDPQKVSAAKDIATGLFRRPPWDGGVTKNPFPKKVGFGLFLNQEAWKSGLIDWEGQFVRTIFVEMPPSVSRVGQFGGYQFFLRKTTSFSGLCYETHIAPLIEPDASPTALLAHGAPRWFFDKGGVRCRLANSLSCAAWPRTTREVGLATRVTG